MNEFWKSVHIYQSYDEVSSVVIFLAHSVRMVYSGVCALSPKNVLVMRAKVVTVMRWYAQDEVNQEDSEQNEVDGMKKGADLLT